MLRIGQWFQLFVNQDGKVTKATVDVLRECERVGLTVKAVDIRVAEADWLRDSLGAQRQDDEAVLVVLVYAIENGDYVTVATQRLVQLEPRHAANKLLASLTPA
jgi:hypothetical protein